MTRSYRRLFILVLLPLLSFTATNAGAEDVTVAPVIDGSLQVVIPNSDGSAQIANVSPDGGLNSVVKLDTNGDIASPTQTDATPGVVPHLNVDENGALISVDNVNPDGSVSSSVTW